MATAALSTNRAGWEELRCGMAHALIATLRSQGSLGATHLLTKAAVQYHSPQQIQDPMFYVRVTHFWFWASPPENPCHSIQKKMLAIGAAGSSDSSFDSCWQCLARHHNPHRRPNQRTLMQRPMGRQSTAAFLAENNSRILAVAQIPLP